MEEAKKIANKHKAPREKISRTGKSVFVRDPKTGKPFMDPLPIVMIDYDMCHEENRLIIPKTSADQLKELAESDEIKTEALKDTMKIMKKMKERPRGTRALVQKAFPKLKEVEEWLDSRD